MRTRATRIAAALAAALLLGTAGCSAKSPEPGRVSADTGAYAIATTDEVKAALDSGDAVVVDARDNNAFIGWPLDGVERGGRIEGATDFSAVWLTIEGEDAEAQAAIDEKLAAALEVKGITEASSVIVYDVGGEDAAAVADYLTEAGVEAIKLYDVTEWAANDSLPMESYPNYELLVPASYVKDAIEKGDVKVFETSWGEETDEYKAAHIPGAVHINTDEVEVGPLWKRRPIPELEAFAKANGITADTKVVLYGSDSMPAHRVQAILMWMGVKDVRVLNGGFAAWERAGFETEAGSNAKVAGGEFGVTIPGRADYIVDMPEAKAILADSENASLVDIRSWEEHIGETPGYSDISEAGRPDGARFGGDMPGDNANVDGTMRNFDEVLANWAEWGITPDQKLAFFCGTGWRAAQMLVYADVAGLGDIALYDSGWYEWIMVGDNAKATGEPVKP